MLCTYAASLCLLPELTRSSFLSRSPDEAFPGGLGCGRERPLHARVGSLCCLWCHRSPCEKAEKEAKLVTPEVRRAERDCETI